MTLMMMMMMLLSSTALVCTTAGIHHKQQTVNSDSQLNHLLVQYKFYFSWSGLTHTHARSLTHLPSQHTHAQIHMRTHIMHIARVLYRWMNVFFFFFILFDCFIEHLSLVYIKNRDLIGHTYDCPLWSLYEQLVRWLNAPWISVSS